MSPINIQPPSPTALPCKVAELAKCAKKEFSPHFHLPNTYPWLPLYLCLYHRNTAHTELLPEASSHCQQLQQMHCSAPTAVPPFVFTLLCFLIALSSYIQCPVVAWVSLHTHTYKKKTTQKQEKNNLIT